MATPKDQYWEIRLEQMKETLEGNGFAVSIQPSAADAARFVMDQILPQAPGPKVAFGGSATLVQSGVLDRLRSDKNVDLIDTLAPGISREQVIEMRRESLLCDLYLASSNALTRRGELVNLDMIGNRVGAINFGPRKVALLIGRNKIVENLDEARTRVKELAAPINTMRIGSKTPCRKVARCMDCKSPDRICNVWTITEKCFPVGRIHVLLINEDLGF